MADSLTGKETIDPSAELSITQANLASITNVLTIAFVVLFGSAEFKLQMQLCLQ